MTAARHTALLDACVLYPMAIADSLMSLAAAGLFAAKWTQRIEDEWIRALEERRPDIKGKLGFRRDQMRLAVPDREVTAAAWRARIGDLTLPDPNDVHVLAAAIAGRSNCIVTANLKDFPATALEPHGIEAIHPDRFIVQQWAIDPLSVVAAFKHMRARWKKPSATPEDFARAMERGGLPLTARRLREASDSI